MPLSPHGSSPQVPAPAASTTGISSPEAIGAAFHAQKAHQWHVRRRTAAERVATLRKLKAAIVTHRESLLDAMHADFRKNRSEAELSEIQLVLTELNEAIARVPRWMKPVGVPTPLHMWGTHSEIRYEPRGAVLIMAAWNYPFALIFAPLVAAVAAGNCAVVRPSEKVPRTNAVSRQILSEVFDPAEVVLVGGDQSTARLLLDLPFDHVFFTGSTPVGRQIMNAVSGHLSSVTLELGGKSPAIVDESADIAHASRCIMWGKFVNAGQTCVAPDYAFVHAARADEFFEASRKTLATFYGADEAERQASDDYCRMIDAPSWARVSGLLEAAVRAGARIEAGGRVDAAERYIAPTILSCVEPASAVMADEIFGPVLPVLTYRSTDEVVAFLHARPKPLAMYVFGRNRQSVEDVLSRTAAGGTVVNNCLIHLVNPNLPFGGTGASGFGSYHGRFGFEAFSHARPIVVQGRPMLSHLFYPPYARLKTGWLGLMLALARRLRD